MTLAIAMISSFRSDDNEMGVKWSSTLPCLWCAMKFGASTSWPILTSTTWCIEMTPMGFLRVWPWPALWASSASFTTLPTMSPSSPHSVLMELFDNLKFKKSDSLGHNHHPRIFIALCS